MTDQEILWRTPGVEWSWSDQYLAIGGRRLHYIDFVRAGKAPGGRAAVLLHGMTSHADSWRLVIGTLTAVDRVVCPDFRGHGFSDWTRDGYWLSDYAADVCELVASLGLGRFDLAGHSLGARVCMVLGGMLGSNLRSLTLSDTGPEISREGALKAREIGKTTTQDVPGFRNVERLRETLNDQHPDWDPDAIEVRIARLYRPNWAGVLVHRGDPEVMWLLGRAGLAEVDQMWAGLRATKAPALIVRGKLSYLLDDELAARMREALAAPEYLELDTGHEMLYIKPRELFGPTLDHFLSTT